MAIPTISTVPKTSAFIDAKADTVSPVIDYETGGIALQDPSSGLQYQVWVCKTDGSDITIEADNSPAQVIYSGINITEISLAFDSNMNYLVAFVEDGQAKFKWFDSTISDFTVTSLDAADENPRCTLDDKRAFNNSGRSIQLVYLRNDNLYARYQNDRYVTEYNLGPVTAGLKLAKIGMMDNLRVGYVLSTSLYLYDILSEPFKINETLEFSCFLKQYLGALNSRIISVANNNAAVRLMYTDSIGLYVLLPNNIKVCILTDVEEAILNVNSFVAVNVYLEQDDRVGFEEYKKTVVKLYYKNTSACNDMIVKTDEVYFEQLNNTVFDHLFGDSKIRIGGGKGAPNSESFIIDSLLVSSDIKTIGEYKLYIQDLGICGSPPTTNLTVQEPTLKALGSLALYPNNAYAKFYINSALGEYKAETFQNNNVSNTDRGPFVIDPNDPDFEAADYEIYATNNGGDVPTSGIALNTWHDMSSIFVYWEWAVTVSYQTKTIALLVTVRRKDDISNTVTFELSGFVTKEN